MATNPTAPGAAPPQAVPPDEALADIENPAGVFMSEMLASLDRLSKLQTELEQKKKDLSLRMEARIDADNLFLELTSKIGLLRNAMIILVTGTAGVLPPSNELAAATMKFAKDLGEVVADANRPRTIVNIATTFVNGAVAVATKKVDPQPPAAVAAAAG